MKQKRCPICHGRVRGLVRQKPHTGWINHKNGKRHKEAAKKFYKVDVKMLEREFSREPDWALRSA